MKIKWSGIGMTDGRGKINGSVASKNRSGAYVRTKVTPVNPRSVAQQNIRGIFASISERWRNLSQQERNSWNEATENWKKTDIFGDLKKPSGFNLFMRLATPLQHTFDDVIIASYAPTPVPMPGIKSFSATITITSGNITGATITGEAVAGGVDLEEYAIQVYATPPTPVGISFVDNRLRYIGFIEFSEFATGASVKTMYEEKFGKLSDEENIFFSIKIIARATGQVSAPRIALASTSGT